MQELIGTIIWLNYILSDSDTTILVPCLYINKHQKYDLVMSNKLTSERDYIFKQHDNCKVKVTGMLYNTTLDIESIEKI